jgi:hypothetical protein
LNDFAGGECPEEKLRLPCCPEIVPRTPVVDELQQPWIWVKWAGVANA